MGRHSFAHTWHYTGFLCVVDNFVVRYVTVCRECGYAANMLDNEAKLALGLDLAERVTPDV